VDTSSDIADSFHCYKMEWTLDIITMFADDIELFSIDVANGLKDEFKPFNSL
jgi:beta-glucanase (GH16 family)